MSAKKLQKPGADAQQQRLTCSGVVRRRCVVAQMQGEIDFGPVVLVIMRSQTGVLRGFLIDNNCELVATACPGCLVGVDEALTSCGVTMLLFSLTHSVTLQAYTLGG